jgi:hypothetical protein
MDIAVGTTVRVATSMLKSIKLSTKRVSHRSGLLLALSQRWITENWCIGLHRAQTHVPIW